MKFTTFLVFPAFSYVAIAFTVTDLFVTKNSGPGACDATQTPIVESWLADTITLVDTALLGLQAFKTDKFIRRNLGAFFGIRSKGGKVVSDDQDNFNTIQTTLQSLQDFLNRRDPKFTVEGDGTGKPWLFCNSIWQEETKDLFDENGVAVPDPADNTKQASLRTYPPTTGNDVMDELLTAMQQGTSPNWASFAYYSSDLRDYVIEQAKNRYPGTPPSLCNGADVNPPEDRFGFTEDRLTRDTITLCPDAFTDTSEPFETIAEAMADGSSKTLNTPLNNASPRSLTLFHELIHMTTGLAETPDTANKPTQCLAKTLAGADSVKNPDSYVFMAWSYYLTINGNPTFEWQTGLAKTPK